MTYTILFVLTLVVVSGLIAYLGDWLGRRMGKRRLTLLGLRPRHTAIVVTTITGMIIAAVTLGMMITVSSSLRKVFYEGEHLVREINAYQAKNRDLREKNVELSAMSVRLTREVRNKSAQVRNAQREVAAARKEAADAIKARDQVRLLVKSLEGQIRERQVELADLRRTGRLTEEQLKRASSTLDERVKELAGVKESLAARNIELEEKRRNLDEKNQELAGKVAQLEEAEAQIKEAEATVRRHRELIEAQRQRLVAELMRTEQLLTGDLVLQQGQEIARRVIDASLPREQVQAELVRLLDRASEAAARYQAGPNRDSRAVQLVYLDRNTGNVVDDENLCIARAADVIVQQGRNTAAQGVLVRVTVVSNTLRGDTALVEFGPLFHWNKLAYRKGERIARCMVDGRLSEGRILLAVLDFLRSEVRSAAQKEGVVPVATPEPGGTLEPLTDEQLDYVMELVETIRDIGKSVELKATARADIYSAGPLNLSNIDFSVSTLTSASR